MRHGSRSPRLSPHDAARSSRAPSIAREHPRPGRPLRAEPEGGGEVAPAHHDIGSADRAAPAPQLRPDRGRGGHGRRVPPPHPPAARRRPGPPARRDPQAQRSALHRCLQTKDQETRNSAHQAVLGRGIARGCSRCRGKPSSRVASCAALKLACKVAVRRRLRIMSLGLGSYLWCPSALRSLRSAIVRRLAVRKPDVSRATWHELSHCAERPSSPRSAPDDAPQRIALHLACRQIKSFSISSSIDKCLFGSDVERTPEIRMSAISLIGTK
jgi:hypothetical protein